MNLGSLFQPELVFFIVYFYLQRNNYIFIYEIKDEKHNVFLPFKVLKFQNFLALIYLLK